MSPLFPTTRRSVFSRARRADEEIRRQAHETLVKCYWKPVYKYLRVRWSLTPEEAEDATQEFFLKTLEKQFFQSFDPARARFRTYIRLSIDTLIMKDYRAAKRLKRGGQFEHVQVDFDCAEGEIGKAAGQIADPDAFFHREWVRGIVDSAVEYLREKYGAAGKQIQFAVFERYDLESPDSPSRPRYEDLAAELGITTTQVTNYLFSLRKAFKNAVVAKLRESTGSEAECRAEASALFGGPGADRRA